MRESFVDFVGGVENLRRLASQTTMLEAVRNTGFEISCVRKLAQKYRIRFMRKCQTCEQVRAPEKFNKSASVCMECVVTKNQRPAGNHKLWIVETRNFGLSMRHLSQPMLHNSTGPLSYWRQPNA